MMQTIRTYNVRIKLARAMKDAAFARGQDDWLECLKFNPSQYLNPWFRRAYIDGFTSIQ